MEKIGALFAVILLTLLAVFIVQNLQDVQLIFLSWEGHVTLAGPICASYVLGGLTARPAWRFFRSQQKQRREQKKAVPAKQPVPPVTTSTITSSPASSRPAGNVTGESQDRRGAS